MNQNTYTRISASDFEQYLTDSFGEWESVSVAGTKELVYDLPVAQSDDLTVRVFSSVAARDGAGRDAGADAIKCVVWSDSRDRPVATAKRTNRIQTWRKNLTPKIDDLREQAREMAAEDEAETDAAVAAVESLPVTTGDENEVVVRDLTRNQFGAKAVLESPFAAKDAIKSLDWDTTHRAWDADAKAWTVDAEALAAVADHLGDAGWSLVAADLDAEPAFSVVDAMADLEIGQHVTVTYEQKNHNGTNEKAGVVENFRPGGFSFRRDDGQLMLTRENDLFTAGSHAPFVGRVVGIDAN